jgi:5-formyltetrahydrofolate cyclo-ligase
MLSLSIMSDSIKERKATMRKEMLSKRAFLDREKKAQYDNCICLQLWDVVVQNQLRVIHVYVPMASEIDITLFIQKCLDAHLTVIAPKTLKQRKLKHLQLKSMNELESGVFGTKHPAGEEEYTGKLDLIVAPGLAFDKHKYRLGYGAGYYDNFLVHQSSAKKIAIAYPFQLVDEVPIEPHDVSLDDVMTCTKVDL